MTRNSIRIGRNQAVKSNGFILLFIVLTVIGIGAAILLVGLGAGIARTEQRIARAAVSEGVLNDARQLLIAYVISPPSVVLISPTPNSRPSSSIRPGTLPTPDSWGNTNYDGLEEGNCLGNTTNGLPAVGGSSLTRRCLGKFPWKTIALDVGPGDAHDPDGRVPWLAVSSNLIWNDSCLNVLNSDVANVTTLGACGNLATPVYPQPTTIPYPWLKVYDQNGAILSSKVAAVLILPGPPITTESRTQGRTVLNPGHPADYLDSVNLPLGCTSGCTLYDNAGLNNEFIMIPSGTAYPADAQDTAKRGQPLKFNDVLVYLTIDEVMHYAEKRVAVEMAQALKTFTADATANPAGKYPWLQALTTSFADSTSLYSQQNTIFGAFPFLTNDIDAKYRTDFTWVLTGSGESTFWGATATPPVCFRIGTGPNRWVRNPLINTLNASTSYGGPFANSSALVANSTCKWLGGTKVECESNEPGVNKSFTPYSSQGNCNSQSSPLGAITLTVARKISLINDASSCQATPAITYAAASGTNVHRWLWACGSSSQNAIVEVTDTISSASYNRLPTTARLTSAGAAQNFALNGMRYQPIMPAWFFHNRWYASAFAAWAPGATKLPSAPSPNPCGAATALNVGSATVNTGVIILAGPPLTGQTRPAATISTYLEVPNDSAGTNCVLTNSAGPASQTLNDNIIVLP